jgi:hypothetical protein
MDDEAWWNSREITIENFGITKSPLDAYRGSGRHAKGVPPAKRHKSTAEIKEVLQLSSNKEPEAKIIVLDVAGNSIEIKK